MGKRNNSDDEDNGLDGFESKEEDENNKNAAEAAAENIREACLHVNQAKSQHELANKKIKASQEENIDGSMSHSEKLRCIIMDYSQNAGLPQFGDSQAGPSYYYSPININIFGIVDASIQGGRLDAYIYH